MGPKSVGFFDLRGGSLTADTITGSLVNGGVFIPFSNSLGGTTLTGNYTQTPAGVLRINVLSPGNYGALSVGGSSALNGRLQPTLLGGYIPAQGQVFPNVLTATGGYTGAFSSVGNFTPTLTGRARYNPNGVDLMAIRDYTNPALVLTPNQWAAGNMLNGLANTTFGDLGAVLAGLDALMNPGDVAAACQQISPDKIASLTTLGFAGAGLFRQGLSDRINGLRYGGLSGGGVLGGLGSLNLNYTRGSGLMLAYNSSDISSLITARRPQVPENRWGVYVAPGVVLGSQSSSSRQTGFDFTLAGFTAGAD
jgi:hypothetical protein